MSLNRASAKGDLASVKKLVAEGEQINATDSSGRTPLIEAAWGGHADVVKFLLDKGADPNIADKAGFTAVMRAAEEGFGPVVTALVNKSADVNKKGVVRGTTALMLAAEKGNIKMIDQLLAAGAKINELDDYEESAVARAYRANQMKAGEHLESKGGRGKPERNSFTTHDRENRSISKSGLPQWSAAAVEGGYDDMGGDEGGAAAAESYDE